MIEEYLFPQPATFEPTSKHTQTIILLHGRGSTGQEFAEELFAAELSAKHETLRQRFPNYRQVSHPLARFGAQRSKRTCQLGLRRIL